MAELAQQLGYPDAQIVSGGVAAAVSALNSRPKSPEYMILDTGASTSDILASIDELAQHCEPTLRVVVVGTVNDITFYRELKARGILEYFTRPAKASDIRAVLVQAAAAQRASQGGNTGAVITCMSAASGDGASTLAMNLAYCMAKEYKQSTVLVDMDYQFGLVAKSLDLAAPFGIRELFDYPDRGLDELLVNKMLVKYRETVNIISAPNDLRLMPPIKPEVIRELISILRSKFQVVIIDVPHVWTDWTAAALTYSDHTVMVAQLWLRSLTHASRLLTAWQTVGIAREAISLVINRSGAKFKEAITAQDFERICHHKIEGHVNNDVKAVVMAENNGQTLFESGQGELLKEQIKQISQLLLSRTKGTAIVADAPVADAGKKGLRRSLFDKKS